MFKKKPFFIVFEGVEVVENLIKVKNFNKLLKNRVKAILTREPGGTKSAELIRNLILKDYFKKSKKENLINIQIHYFI